jgi:hypothetical protein
MDHHRRPGPDRHHGGGGGRFPVPPVRRPYEYYYYPTQPNYYVFDDFDTHRDINRLENQIDQRNQNEKVKNEVIIGGVVAVGIFAVIGLVIYANKK